MEWHRTSRRRQDNRDTTMREDEIWTLLLVDPVHCKRLDELEGSQ